MKEIDIKRLSRLANIELDKEEEKKLKEDLDKIIKHIRKIQEVKINEIPDASYLTVESLPLRSDRKEKSLSVKEVLSNTKNPRKNHFTINKIVNENDY
jgi:aspartyl/glutamyl-tRNA(Asn/Gln) amidotransferase C subunit